jgi:hypothetical protein
MDPGSYGQVHVVLALRRPLLTRLPALTIATAPQIMAGVPIRQVSQPAVHR